MRRVLTVALFLALLPPRAIAVESGAVAPAFEGAGLADSGKLRLEDYRGKVVYLDFWASWCGPCRQSLPWLSQMRADYGSQGFEVVAINVDERSQDGMDFLKKYPVTYPTVRDAEGRIARLYDVKTMPMSYLIDREGKVRLVHQGFNKKDTPQLRAAVTRLLAENP